MSLVGNENLATLKETGKQVTLDQDPRIARQLEQRRQGETLLPQDFDWHLKLGVSLLES